MKTLSPMLQERKPTARKAVTGIEVKGNYSKYTGGSMRDTEGNKELLVYLFVSTVLVSGYVWLIRPVNLDINMLVTIHVNVVIDVGHQPRVCYVKAVISVADGGHVVLLTRRSGGPRLRHTRTGTAAWCTT